MSDINFRDVTILYTEKDEAWCDYIVKSFKLDKLNIHILNVSKLEYRNPPEIEVAVRESYVVVLLATSYMLDYMEVQAEWFAKMLREKKDPAFTSLIVTLIGLRKEECNDVLSVSNYVIDKNDDYSLLEVDVEGANIKDIISAILESRDRNEAKKIKKKKKRDIVLEIIPTSINGPGDKVAILFTEEIIGEVTVNFIGIKEEIKTNKINPYTVTFTVPDISSDKIGMQVNLDGSRIKRLYLNDKFTSVEFMRQSYGLSSKEELDRKLADVFNKSLCNDTTTNQILVEIYKNTITDIKDEQSKYPTVLHWAAGNGLSELCSALLSCASASAAACKINNCDGRDPAELARRNGHQEIYDLLFDFAETKEIADSCDIYVQYLKPENYYEIMHPSRPGAPVSPQQLMPKVIKDPPPIPSTKPPFPKKSQEKPLVDEEIYVMPDGVTPAAIKDILPAGAMGSHSQTELIKIQEDFKNGKFSIEDVESLFNSWKERNETGKAVSFKERKEAIMTFRADHSKIMEAIKTTQSNKNKKIKKEDSFSLEISEPFALRTSGKISSARGSNFSNASTMSSISTSSSDSGRNSTDSQLSCDGYDDRRVSTREMYADLDDYPDPDLTPPPLPPARQTSSARSLNPDRQANPERIKNIKGVPGKPEPPATPPKPKSGSLKKS